MAAARIVQHSVFHAVQRVALVVHSVRKNMDFAGRNVTVACHGERRPEVAADIVMGPVIGWIAGDDAVKIGRVPLRFNHRLMAALGTSGEISVDRLRAVIGLENHLVGLRHQMRGAVGKIHDAIVISQRPLGIGATTLMAGIGAAGGVTLVQRLHHWQIADGSGHAAVPNSRAVLADSALNGICTTLIRTSLPTVAATRQKAGTCKVAGRDPAGKVRVPAATDVAEVILTPGIERDARPSQGC